MPREPGAGPGVPLPPLLRVAVTDLLARRLRSLSPSLGAGPGLPRLWIGSALHGRYQRAAAERDPSFRAEVAVRGELLAESFRVEIHGRADGVRETATGVLRVEELKTCSAASPPSARWRSACRDQAALYAWLLARERGVPVEAELVWLDLAGEEPPLREPVEVGAEAVEATLRRDLAPFLRDAAREQREAPRRRAAAARVRFPHPRRRPGQERLEHAVEQALEAGEHLLAEAPTGLGKTAAVLTPALRFALARDKQVLLLTAKATQRRGALSVLRSLGAGAAAPGLELAARATLCANDRGLCHEDHCRFARDHHAKVEGTDAVAALLAAGPALEPGRVRELATALEACPHALAREAAGSAPLVIGDYNHALAPGAALPAFARGGDPRDVVLVLDEAHNVPERARAVHSAELDADRLRAAAERAGFGGGAVHREVDAALRALADWVEACVDEPVPGGEGAFRTELDADDFRRLREPAEDALARHFAYALATGGLDPEDELAACAHALQRFARGLEAGDTHASLAERRDGRARVARVCLDPSPWLARGFARCHAVIAISATLSPLEPYREALGLDPARTASLALPSPFPRANRRVVIDAGVGTRAGERGREASRIASRLGALAEAVPGHCLALFPSFRLLEAVAAHLPGPPRGPARVLAQRADAGSEERERLVAALRAPAAEHTLVLAVAGGVLAEGVDYAGGGLAAVAVVGPCVPPPDPERELQREAWEERGEDGFLRAYAMPGMTRVVQAAGRLLRSPEDVGVIALLGRRFLQAPYRDALPEEWCDGDPEGCVGDPAEAARELFEMHAP